MPFLRGSLAFERFAVQDFDANQFDEGHLETLLKFAAGQVDGELLADSADDDVRVGFLGGDHLLDQEFSLDKNVIDNSLHCAVRIDTNVIPSAIRNAWLQIELAGRMKESETGFLSKSDRKEAKEAVQQRCEVEAASGKYRKMQTASFLWDLNQSRLYFGGPVGNASGHCLGLLERAFGVSFTHISAGAVARDWAIDTDRFADLDDQAPIDFVTGESQTPHVWTNEFSQVPDFLGNEFLMWLWWITETQTDTLDLADQSQVVVMFAKTLALDCPKGDSGKETITAESPVALPEAITAIRSGKLPRKAGLTLIRAGRQFDLIVQAESFGVSAAKIHLDEDEEFEDTDRIDAIRLLSDSLDHLFHVFLERRISDQWPVDLTAMHHWLGATAAIAKVA